LSLIPLNITTALIQNVLRGFSSIAKSVIVGLDIYLFALVSGASMNPARSFAPALLSASVGDL
jgi:aquaporin Z